MVRVFQVDLLRLKHQDLSLHRSSHRLSRFVTAEAKIRRALADGTAIQIGWLVEGDELRIDTSKYGGGFIGEVLAKISRSSELACCGLCR